MPNALIPELAVLDWRASLDFYCRILGFSVRHAREAEGFALLELGQAELMIDGIGLGRDFEPDGRLRRPLGAGLNLQLLVPDVEAVLAWAEAARLPVLLPLEDRWYGRNGEEIGQRQFVIADPDGYLVGPMRPLGTRPAVGVASPGA